MARREFSRKVRVAAFKRADGKCEVCGVRLVPGRFRYDHIIPDALGGDPTLENCKVQCDACDAPKTASDQTRIAKAKRVEAKHIGAIVPKAKIPSRGFPKAERERKHPPAKLAGLPKPQLFR
jgi:5-methylcytosine-specific restriction enzyme A